MATFTNIETSDFAENWLLHLARVGLRRSALVGATDDAAAAHLAPRVGGAHCFRIMSQIGRGEAKWGSPGFAHMGRTKAQLLRQLLSYNTTVLFADVDVVILHDPRPFLGTALSAGADVLFHTDGFGSSTEVVSDGGLERPEWGWGPELNTGLFLATPRALALAQRWCEAVASDAAFANWKNDQQALNELMRQDVRVPLPSTGSMQEARPHGSAVAATATDAVGDAATRAIVRLRMRSRLIRAFGGQLLLGLLPSHLFPSGHVFFIQRALHKLNLVPLAVHLTFQNCDQAGKRHRMREGGLWLLDTVASRYYTPAGGLLSYEPDLPPSLTRRFGQNLLLPRNLRISDPIVQGHFQLVNHQLQQLRTALALAVLLNRTLLLPRFVCGLETVTNFPHRGIRCLSSNGCRMALPYYCPADHVLRMHYWREVMPQVPVLSIRYREWSLLDSLRARAPHTLQEEYEATGRTLTVGVRGSLPARQCDRCGESGYVGRAGQTPGAVAVASDPVTPSALAAKAAAGHIELPGGAEVSEAQLNEALGSGAPRRAALLHFKSLRVEGQAGLRLALPEATKRKFEQTILYLGGGFCCVEPEQPGAHMHFWYDLLWDTPHVDRWNRRWTREKPWVPTVGP